jgi:hypothetical protein
MTEANGLVVLYNETAEREELAESPKLGKNKGYRNNELQIRYTITA